MRATRTALTLHDVEWIRGVSISGRLDARGRGTVTVTGPNAAPGTVTLTPARRERHARRARLHALKSLGSSVRVRSAYSCMKPGQLVTIRP